MDNDKNILLYYGIIRKEVIVSDIDDTPIFTIE